MARVERLEEAISIKKKEKRKKMMAVAPWPKAE